MSSRRLSRLRDRVLGGVLAGFAEYTDANKMLVRLLYVLLSLFSAGFFGFVGYVISWIITPEIPTGKIPYSSGLIFGFYGSFYKN